MAQPWPRWCCRLGMRWQGLFVDIIGVGGAVYDALKGSVRVAGVNFAEGAPMDRDKSGKLKFGTCARWPTGGCERRLTRILGIT
jgi:hypothetical protein